jgi:hypothetical protein
MGIRLKIVAAILSISIAGYSQNVSNPDLDSHRKFSEIYLGDSFEKWKIYLRDKDPYKESIVTYTLQNEKCCNSVFGYTAQTIKVTFENAKVVSIYIELGNFLDGKNMNTVPDFKFALENAVSNYLNINDQFEVLFGKPHYSDTNKKKVPDEPLYTAQWIGARTQLETDYFLYDAVYDPARTVDPKTGYTKKLKEAYDTTIIIISDLEYLKRRLKSEF